MNENGEELGKYEVADILLYPDYNAIDSFKITSNVALPVYQYIALISVVQLHISRWQLCIKDRYCRKDRKTFIIHLQGPIFLWVIDPKKVCIFKKKKLPPPPAPPLHPPFYGQKWPKMTFLLAFQL